MFLLLNKKLITSLFLVAGIPGFAQNNDFLLQKKFAAGIELNYPYYFEGFPNDLPFINVSGQYLLSPHFSLNLAFFPAFQTSHRQQNHEGTWENFALGLSSIYYLNIGHRFFFEPELDVYLNNVLVHHDINEGSGPPQIQSFTTTYLQLGAGFGFEYFFSSHISLNSCIYNLAYGWALNQSGFNYSNLYSTRTDVYKAISLGIKYHFGKSKE